MALTSAPPRHHVILQCNETGLDSGSGSRLAQLRLLFQAGGKRRHEGFHDVNPTDIQNYNSTIVNLY
jgi:hypothetical protein